MAADFRASGGEINIHQFPQRDASALKSDGFGSLKPDQFTSIRCFPHNRRPALPVVQGQSSLPPLQDQDHRDHVSVRERTAHVIHIQTSLAGQESPELDEVVQHQPGRRNNENQPAVGAE